MLRFSSLALVLAALVLTACGGGGGGRTGSPSSGGSGDAAKGKVIFETKGCVACHTLAGATGAVGTTGPNLNGIGTRAETRKPNMSADAYIRESEQNPNAFVVDGFPRDTMVTWTGTPAELSDLVTYLLAQK